MGSTGAKGQQLLKITKMLINDGLLLGIRLSGEMCFAFLEACFMRARSKLGCGRGDRLQFIFIFIFVRGVW